ncbi:shikimate kinase [Synechocystis salina LEGE 06155]|nr:shikimate kinase [Synechocystis salina LEGE 06155]
MAQNLIKEQLQGVNLFLIGMMGSGKSTVGPLLAEQLGYRFFDADVLIERVAGKAIADIFAEDGEDTFRDLETEVLGHLAAQTRSVIATGGGVVLRRQNWSYLHHGLVIWLDGPLELLLTRLQGDEGRPLLQVENLEERLGDLITQRQPLYAQADLRFPLQADQDPAAIAAELLAIIPGLLKPQCSAEQN